MYSLQNCPYAIRARYALFKANQRVLIRAIKLNNKPAEMLAQSIKGSVPVLCVDANHVIDESVDIMRWALLQNDPDDLLHFQNVDALNTMLTNISDFERTFIPNLERYCCAKRYHEDNLIQYRNACEMTLKRFEHKLTHHRFLFSERESLMDIALFPFLRKFARVERQWYLHSPYSKVRDWLNYYLQNPIFTKVMVKHDLWLEERKNIYFPR